jgi:murein DD-endopeptidase MepM/ murein hydrolase activator NlpD
MRSNNRIFSGTSRLNSGGARLRLTVALCAVVAVFAAPAVAAQSVAPATGSPVALRAAVAKIAKWAQRTAREERARARRAEGPFVPIVGAVDYGTAENAFGAARSGHVHAGQDMFADAGTPLVAAADAVVLDTGADGGQGNYVHLYDPKRELTYVYMHMVEPAKVRAGEQVQAGQALGGVGCTGSCWGDHLHFEVRDGRGYEGESRDPMPLLSDWRSIDEPR